MGAVRSVPFETSTSSEQVGVNSSISFTGLFLPAQGGRKNIDYCNDGLCQNRKGGTGEAQRQRRRSLPCLAAALAEITGEVVQARGNISTVSHSNTSSSPRSSFTRP